MPIYSRSTQDPVESQALYRAACFSMRKLVNTLLEIRNRNTLPYAEHHKVSIGKADNRVYLRYLRNLEKATSEQSHNGRTQKA